MKTVRFGIVGCGLMGREFASAAARWCHLPKMDIRPEVAAICNRTLSPDKIGWFTDHIPTLRQVTDDYRKLLANPDIDAVYVAVPHHLHQEIFCAALEAGKHLLGEKPFGIDLAAHQAILRAVQSHPRCVARCASQYLFYPGVQAIFSMLKEGAFGQIIEVDAGFFHSSDLNADKPINWKRVVSLNGEYGSMGDLGVHVALVPARAGWRIGNVRAICSNLVTTRPDASGRRVPCETWDNVTILAGLIDPESQTEFPMNMRIHRIMPGEMNTWFAGIYGTRACARFSLKNPRCLEVLRYEGGRQNWERVDLGFDTPYQTVTGSIFEFGGPDAFMQMVAAFLDELSHGGPRDKWVACPTPDEVHWCHRLFTAALESNRQGAVVQAHALG